MSEHSPAPDAGGTLLEPTAIARGLRRVAVEIAERGRGVKDLALVGIRRGGVPLAARLAALLKEIEGTAPPVGAIDITLYRDDAATALPNPRIGPSHIPFAVEGRRVVLVDDVLYTGRTIRAAVDALLDYGRPRRIELVVLVDRGGRELPIQPDYVVRTVEIEASRRVEVVEREGELWAVVVTAATASHPPPPGADEGPPIGNDGKTEEGAS
jgi:pyrimidine operon attenuation protein/uracil phosphoribosyltransferase